MKALAQSIATVLLWGALGSALAQPAAPADGHDSHHSAAPGAAAPQSAPASTQTDPSDLSEGEITRWDPRTLKVTLRHREIKNLGMPPMTMVFRVPDAGMVGGLQPGAKVLFRAEQVNGAYVLTRLQAAP
ncbi:MULTISPECIES: copper-binding protein [Simplicispira]|jgi:Cu/Ag efflux protein CusF|uniref:Cu/Ag efflux protein CusF n=1 Tax=Simplicispira metamorpha TaxID=80881 RepID=A0A4V2SJM2_9BURK|nr:MULTISPECIES: copper-binding protein [Simplicispira]MBP7412828.1 copper-binding protein [Giesbergeria sp.]MDD2690195.1 copper-binding protein [Simplicispira sp.]TCP16186.1 Cu/Ag efflux protein CusF [Simplicispira metamorpha]